MNNISRLDALANEIAEKMVELEGALEGKMNRNVQILLDLVAAPGISDAGIVSRLHVLLCSDLLSGITVKEFRVGPQPPLVDDFSRTFGTHTQSFSQTFETRALEAPTVSDIAELGKAGWMLCCRMGDKYVFQRVTGYDSVVNSTHIVAEEQK